MSIFQESLSNLYIQNTASETKSEGSWESLLMARSSRNTASICSASQTDKTEGRVEKCH